MQFGWIDDETGYLKVTALYGFAPSGRFEDDSLALHAVLDSVAPHLARLTGLVLDLRINGGGYDALARLVAGRLTDRSYLGLVKQARSHPNDARRLTPAQRVTIEPGPAPRYAGPIVLLTGVHTVSAGEVLTLMLMGRAPPVLRIGEATQGVFADELVRRLPNGWRFQLTSERYTSAEGRSFEGPGVPPDLVVPVFPPDERDGRRDGALAAALRALRRARRPRRPWPRQAALPSAGGDPAPPRVRLRLPRASRPLTMVSTPPSSKAAPGK
jgi:C-terminal processing protease CtpA/Prc